MCTTQLLLNQLRLREGNEVELDHFSHTTHCKVLWGDHSQSVTKNLTPYRFNFFEWGLDGQITEIHSFPTMYIIGGGKWGRNGSKQWFSPKKWSKKQLSWVSRFWIIQLRTGLGPKILKVSLTSTGVLKVWNIIFEMSYGQGVKFQYWPNQKKLNFFCGVSPKNAKNGKLLEILILNHISRVPPWESSRPDVSENVVVFVPQSFWTRVIAAQSWRTTKFWVRYQK